MLDRSIDERLRKLTEEFGKLLNGASIYTAKPETKIKDLMSKFGLSNSEAKSWLKHEPNYSSDVSYHEPRNRRKVTRTSARAICSINKGAIDCTEQQSCKVFFMT